MKNERRHIHQLNNASFIFKGSVYDFKNKFNLLTKELFIINLERSMFIPIQYRDLMHYFG